MKKCKMVSVFTQPDLNTREVGRTRDKRRKPRRKAEWFPAYRVCKISNERGTKTMFTYAYVKQFYGQSERAYYLNYFIMFLFVVSLEDHFTRSDGYVQVLNSIEQRLYNSLDSLKSEKRQEVFNTKLQRTCAQLISAEARP